MSSNFFLSSFFGMPRIVPLSEDVLASGEVTDQPRADFDQRRYFAMYFNAASRGYADLRQHFQ